MRPSIHDIDRRARLVYIRHGKGDKARSVMLSDKHPVSKSTMGARMAAAHPGDDGPVHPDSRQLASTPSPYDLL